MKRKDLFSLNSERDDLTEQKRALAKILMNLNVNQRLEYIKSEIEAFENLISLDLALEDYDQFKTDKNYVRCLFRGQIELEGLSHDNA